MLKLISAEATHIGFVRNNNEDAFLAIPEAGLFAIADGMGGAAAGEIASRYFTGTTKEVFGDKISAAEEESSALIEKVFQRAIRRIAEHIAKNPNDEGMGCTGDILLFSDSHYIIGHMGDSRIYLARDEHLRQLTRDQSLVQGLVDEGILTAEEARHHPRKNIILQVVGTDSSVAPDILK